MKTSENLFGVLGFLLLLVLTVGWCMNFYKLITLGLEAGVTNESILRLSGVLLAPIGSLMGFFL